MTEILYIGGKAIRQRRQENRQTGSKGEKGASEGRRRREGSNRVEKHTHSEKQSQLKAR